MDRSAPEASSPPAGKEAGLATNSPDRSGGLAAGPIVLLIAGLVGAGIAWPLVMHFDQFFLISEELRALNPPYSDEAAARIDEEERSVGYLNAMLTFGLFGLATAGTFGLTEGLMRRSAKITVVGILGGGIVGALAGVAAGVAAQFVRLQLAMRPLDDGYKALAIHAIAWIVVGAGLGIAVGMLAGRRAVLFRTGAAGAVAGLVAAVLYSPLAAVLFPLQNSELLLPAGSLNRLLWVSLAGALIGLAVGRAGKRGIALRLPAT